MTSIVTKVEELRASQPAITWEEMARALDLPSGEILRARYRRKKAKQQRQTLDESQIMQGTPEIQFFHEVGKKPDWRSLALRSADIVDEREDASPLIKSTSISVSSDKPIGIVFSGDWHLGDVGINYRDWLRDMETIIEHPRMFLVDLGDDRQNMRSFKDLSGVLAQIMSPQEQAVFMRGLVDELTAKNKLLCKVDGNHDVEFDERIFGEALQDYLLVNMKAPRFRNKGLVFLEVGDEVYTLYVFHRSRFRSMFRAAHGAWREWQFGYPADIVAGGHDHQPAFEMMPNYTMAREAGMNFGGLTFLIKVGTYQESKYGWKYFHNGGRPETITVVLWPNEHRMQAFLSLHDAVRFLDSFQGDNDGEI